MAKKDVNQNQYINNIPNQNNAIPTTNNSSLLQSNQVPNTGFVQYPQAIQNKIGNSNTNVVNNPNGVQNIGLQQNPAQAVPTPQAQTNTSAAATSTPTDKPQKNAMVTFDFAKTPVTQIADYIIIQASKRRASDIHFDPRENGLMVRFRVDGDLADYSFIPKAYQRNLTTRLKLLANMNITESRLPQDGGIKGNYGGKDLDMRVSSLPLNEGEKIVIRILDYSRSNEGIETLGFNKPNLIKLKRMMGIPNGIILVTGATGSGKSTTTYSVLQALNKPETNIITVEDPIEMNIEGVNQVQVNSEIGMTFAAALRSILRQDPNIILIGEIRDSETAQIAVRSAITGHLVLSTIHTNNSLSTIERLLDMDVEKYLLSTAMVGIISQRLAKMICPDCRVKREASPYEKKVFKMFLNEDVDEIWDANPDGCPNCNKGYKGRIAIQEVLEFDDDLRNALNSPNVSKGDISKMVYNGKTITLLQDGLGKVLDGSTSFEEIYRVIEIDTGDEADETYGQTIANSDVIKQMKKEIKENVAKGEKESEEANKEDKKDEVKEETKDDKKLDDKEELKTDEVIIKPNIIDDATKDVKVEDEHKEEESKTNEVIDGDKKEEKVVSLEKKEEKPVVDDKKVEKSSVVLSIPFLKAEVEKEKKDIDKKEIIKDLDKDDKKDNIIKLDDIPVIQSTSDVLNSSIRSGASNVTTLANTSTNLRRSDKDLSKTGTVNSSATIGVNSNIPKVKVEEIDDKKEKTDDKKDNIIDIPSILRQ